MNERNGSNFRIELQAKVSARTPLIGVETYEENRFLRLCRIAAFNLDMRLLVWSCTNKIEEHYFEEELNPETNTLESKWKTKEPSEVKDMPENIKRELGRFDAALACFQHDIKEESEGKQGVLLVCLEPFPYLDATEKAMNDNSYNHRLLKDLFYQFQEEYKTVILAGSQIKPLPGSLEKNVVLIDLPLPDSSLLVEETKAFFEEQDAFAKESEKEGDRVPQRWLQQEVLETFAQAGKGLTYAEYIQAASEGLSTRPEGSDNPQHLLNLLLIAKKRAIKKTGLLDLVEPNVRPEDVGGLDLLKEFLEDSKLALDPHFRALGAPYPKGVLLAGLPGTGKSLLAKMLAALFGLPLLRYDTAKIGTSLHGETERNMRRALDLVEALQPNILWIDEIEKAMAGSGRDLDSGIGEKVKGMLLTWLQEKEGFTYVCGTLNHLERLDAALRRSGRFDEIFHVKLPNPIERAEIIRIHIEKRKNPDQTVEYKADSFDIERLVAASRDFTGAEIESLINKSLLRAIRKDETWSTEHVFEFFDSHEPESGRDVNQLQTAQMQDSLRHCTPASTDIPEKEKISTKTRRSKIKKAPE